MGGGALIIPIVHDITRVNMNAIPVEIRRLGEQSLITRNKMRIDIIAEFFVRGGADGSRGVDCGPHPR
ncbi:hypothetical protein ACFSOZ_16425 [Mesorhizobium newzealandense]|uniref:LysR substrate-binding domain-containing protein n=1 Tax=Mesorhizobium newzealandense TaxID=1300302 RepID=A0ABW4UA48_9HYPH